MDRESFKEYMTNLIEFDNYLSKLDNLGFRSLEMDEIVGIFNGYISLLEAILELPIDEDFGSDIRFWLYECDKGTKDNSYIIDSNGEKHYIRTLDELYDWIQFYREVK